jgi:F-type H+-transporting ATPase subunit b
MISLDISVLYQIIIFVLLWLALSKILFRPYLNLLDERERRTTGAQHDSGELEREGARLKAEYEEKIAQARVVGTATKDAIVQEGRQERERVLQQARDEAGRTLEGARREVQSQLDRERQLLASEVAEVARDMVSKILGRRVG